MTHPYPPPPAGASPAYATGRRFVSTHGVVIAVIMTLLAILGAAVTMAEAAWAGRYWLFLVPVYGLLCVITAWYHTGAFSESVGRQILHWLCVGVAITVDSAYLHGSGQQTATATGLTSLLILALGCLLAGVHLEWLFALVGLLLLLIVVIVAAFQEYLTLVFVIGALVIVAVLFAPRLLRRWAP
jgi:hypothetical protein